MKNIFVNHPRDIGETYFQHMKFAFLFGFKMLIAGFACLVHGIFPFWFEKTGSNALLQMMHDFVERMPPDEKRIVGLSRCIEKKINER